MEEAILSVVGFWISMLFSFVRVEFQFFESLVVEIYALADNWLGCFLAIVGTLAIDTLDREEFVVVSLEWNCWFLLNLL